MTRAALNPIFSRRPILIALAGPNGAGKSTYYKAHLADIGLRFVNADVLALSLGIDAYKAAGLADALRRRLLERRESFIFETVFSDPAGEKLAFLKEAEEADYTVLLIFIGLPNPDLSDTRVAMRAAAGGHDVPRQKLIERFPRTLKNLEAAIRSLKNVWIFDNSERRQPYRLVALREDGPEVELREPIPKWLRELLPRK